MDTTIGIASAITSGYVLVVIVFGMLIYRERLASNQLCGTAIFMVGLVLLAVLGDVQYAYACQIIRSFLLVGSSVASSEWVGDQAANQKPACIADGDSPSRLPEST